MPWNLINDSLEGLGLIQLYGDREIYREIAKKAIVAIEALIKENERLKNNEVTVVDAVRVVHGEWLPIGDDGEYECSVCGWVAARDEYGYHRAVSPYCLYCGAKMESVE